MLNSELLEEFLGANYQNFAFKFPKRESLGIPFWNNFINFRVKIWVKGVMSYMAHQFYFVNYIKIKDLIAKETFHLQ